MSAFPVQAIAIERQPSAERLQALDVFRWPIWSKEVSEFPWTYDEMEICYILAGRALVTPSGREPVAIAAGDLVTFPAGLSCTWQVTEPIRKHYQFE